MRFKNACSQIGALMFLLLVCQWFSDRTEIDAVCGHFPVCSVRFQHSRSEPPEHLKRCLLLPLLQHLSYGNGSLHVDAAFQQTLWSVAPISSGSEAAQGKNSTSVRGLIPAAQLTVISGIVIMNWLLIRAFCVRPFQNADTWHLRISVKSLFRSEVCVNIDLFFSILLLLLQLLLICVGFMCELVDVIHSSVLASGCCWVRLTLRFLIVHGWVT